MLYTVLQDSHKRNELLFKRKETVHNLEKVIFTVLSVTEEWTLSVPPS